MNTITKQDCLNMINNHESKDVNKRSNYTSYTLAKNWLQYMEECNVERLLIVGDIYEI